MSAGRTERLLALVLLLTSTNRPLTRSEIRSAVLDYGDGSADAFERMFERDKDELRSMGIALETVERDDEDEGVGYRLRVGSTYLPALALDPAESMVLALAARAWGEAAWSNSAVLAVRKLEAAGGFEVPAADILALSPNVETNALGSVLEASTTRRRVVFEYRKPGEPTAQTRNVEPWGVVTDQGRWYIVGNDVDRQAVRVFRLSRVVGPISAKGPAEAFAQVAGPDLRSHVSGAKSASGGVSARVKVRPATGHGLRARASAVIDDVAVFEAIDGDWLTTEILRAGSSAEVLKPPAIREAVGAALSATCAAHQVPMDPALQAALAELAKPPTRTRARVEEAAARLSRLLALVPWLQAHPGVTYKAAAQHFGVTPKRLREDLELAVCTEFGPHLLTLDIDCWGDRLTVRDPQGMAAPLRLTPDEAMSLLIGLRLLNQVPGTHNLEALARVESKLADLAGESAEIVEHLEVADGQQPDSPEVATAVAASLAAHKSLCIRYWGAARDRYSERTVDPIRLVGSKGVTYLDAWCRQAEAFRLFRIDRIASATVLDQPADQHLTERIEPGTPETIVGPAAILLLEPGVSWLAEQIPSTAVFVLDDGRTLLRISVGSAAWAVRLVLGMSGSVRVVEPTELVTQVLDEAQEAGAFYPQ